MWIIMSATLIQSECNLLDVLGRHESYQLFDLELWRLGNTANEFFLPGECERP